MHYALICECMYVWVCVYACALGGGRPLSLYIITSGLKPKLSLFLVSPLLKRPWPSSNLALPLSWELLFPMDFEQLTHKIEVIWNASSQGYDYLVLMTAVLECYPDVTPSPLTGAVPIVLYSAMMPWSKRSSQQNTGEPEKPTSILESYGQPFVSLWQVTLDSPPPRLPLIVASNHFLCP